MKTMRTFLLFLGLAFGGLTTAWAQGTASDTIYKHRVYPNAFELMLQKPLRTDTFETRKRLLDHMFIQMGGGVSALLDNTPKPNYTLELRLGDWLTPVHGIRLGGTVGGVKRGTTSDKRGLFVGLQADWMLNLTNLANGGFDPHRRWSFSTLLGVDALLAKQEGQRKLVPGVHGGLHAEVQLTNYTALYLEPRLSLVSDHITPMHDRTGTWKPYDYMASVTAGLSFRRLPMWQRSEHPTYRAASWLDGTFITVGAAPAFMVSRHFSDTPKNNGFVGSLGIGKQFNAFSALRLKGKIGVIDVKDVEHVNHGMAQLDYVFNLSGGQYLQSRPVWMNLVVGADLAVSKQKDQNAVYTPGIGGGVQFNVRTGRSSYFYLEPRVDVFKDKFYPSFSTFEKYDVMASLEAGFTFHRNEVENWRRNPRPDNRVFGWGGNLFIDAGVGAASAITKKALESNAWISASAHVALGTWITPKSGLRLDLLTTQLCLGSRQRPNKFHLTEVGADYLWNLTTHMGGYNPQRRFEMYALAGPRLAKRSYVNTFYLGASAGVQALYHLNDMLGLFLEPSVQTYHKSLLHDGAELGDLRLMGRVMGGVNVRMRNQRRLMGRMALAQAKQTDFVFVMGGLRTDMIEPRQLHQAYKAGFGRHYNNYAAWRAYASTNFFLTHDGKTNRTGAGADWLWDLTEYNYGANPSRRFSFSTIVGAELAQENRDARRRVFSPEVHVGGQMALQVSPAVQLVAEPTLGARWSSLQTGSKMELDAQLQVGVVYQADQLVRNAAEGRAWYADLTAGSGMRFNSATRYKRQGAFNGLNMEGAVGHWFTDQWALQLSIRSHNHQVQRGRYHYNYNVNSLGAEVRRNVWRVKNADAQLQNTANDVFRLSVLAGPSINRIETGFSAVRQYTVGIRAGVQANYALTPCIDLVFRPDVNIYRDILGAGRRGAAYDLGLQAGVSLKL